MFIYRPIFLGSEIKNKLDYSQFTKMPEFDSKPTQLSISTQFNYNDQRSN